MPTIKALKNIRVKGAHLAMGDVVETDAATARDLVRLGFAEQAEKPAAPPPKKRPAAKKKPAAPPIPDADPADEV
jgi:hypothetical protein